MLSLTNNEIQVKQMDLSVRLSDKNGTCVSEADEQENRHHGGPHGSR